MMRFCIVCETEKPVSEFQGKKYGKQCEDCRRKKRREEKRQPEYKAACRELLRKQLARMTDEEKDARRLRLASMDFFSRYGITFEDRDAMVMRQGGRCLICAQKPKGKGHCGRLHLDHCHKTNKVRGLLCSNCNHLLGQAKDNPAVLLDAIKYLERTR